MSAKIVRKILSNLNCEVHDNDKSILRYDDKVNFIHFVQSGTVQLFDKYHNPILEYGQGSFFGEYQILLDLFGCLTYRTKPRIAACNEQMKRVVLFQLDRQIFMDIITQEKMHCFEFYLNMAIARYKFNEKQCCLVQNQLARQKETFGFSSNNIAKM